MLRVALEDTPEELVIPRELDVGDYWWNQHDIWP
jgi:hypothetical protein